MAIVQLKQLSKYYSGQSEPAVDAVSLTVDDGEFMVLLGPSGCGKSTTLRMVAGLESISAGELLIDDVLMNKIPAKDRDIAMVFQSYALYPHMTVRDNMAFGLRRRGIKGAELERRVRATAETIGLTPYLDRKPHALSGGQRQRVALGRAIVRNPKVFLLDEPLSNLDAALRVSTRSELVKQQRNLGTTMIYVTHDQIEAMTMGHRICIMNKGRIAQVGSPLEVYRYPADTFVARFLGSPGMNLLPAGCTHENAQPVLRIGNNSIPLDTLSIAPALAADSDVILGIRPEDLYERPERAQGRPTAALRASVNIVEPLGADTLLLLALDGTPHEIVARVGRDSTARNGDTLDIHLDISALRLFDPHNEKALAVPAEA